MHYRPCWVEIRLGAVQQNLQALRRRLSPSTKILTVVKADAYGHGLIPVARAVAETKVDYLGVSSIEEGILLRKAGLALPILILGSLYPFDSFPALAEHHLAPTVASWEMAEALNQLACRREEQIPVHLKIDTGFGRIGVSAAHALNFIGQVARCSGLRLEGLYTHFSSSDMDPAATREQMAMFQSVVSAAAAGGIRPSLIHMANSSAILQYPDSHGTLVRPGLALYGIPPYPGSERLIALEPALTWKTRVVFLKMIPEGASVSYARTWTARRPTRVATLAVGYADGLPRVLSNKGCVLLGGQRVPVIGRVTMDMTMVDVTDLPSCHIGDEAILIGRQGSQTLGANEMAECADTNPYEILCRIAGRVPRLYADG